MQVDILVGIPSLNEASTIANVVTQIDTGLHLYYPDCKALIVNFDNDSPDGTRDVFLEVKTAVPTRYISTSKGVLGKGNNLRNFFRVALELQVKAAAIFDADLESISPRWVKNVLHPILEENYDFVFPVYKRHKYEGTATNFICYPVVYGLFASNVRQPIAGDFGFSQNLIQHLVAVDYPEQAHQYGVDIFVTTESIVSNAKICSVLLGQKIHRKRDRVTIGPMNQEVVATLFQQVQRYHQLLLRRDLVTHPPIFADAFEEKEFPSIPVDTRALIHLFAQGFLHNARIYAEAFSQDLLAQISEMVQDEHITINTDRWCDIVYSLLRYYLHNDGTLTAVSQAIIPLFFGRLVSFIQETASFSNDDIEEYVANQAHVFYEKRATILNLPSTMHNCRSKSA